MRPKEISAGELKTKLVTADPIAVLDIRERGEFESWHIRGSTNLPVYDALRNGRAEALTGRLAELPRDRSIVVVCRRGVVSRKAVELLCGLGYDAASLTGGMRDWGGVWTEATIASNGTVVVQLRRNGKGCLSYVVGSRGEAAIVDPSLEIDAYLAAAKREGLRITHVLETHVHADHLSRARELSGAAGAKLVLPANDRVTYAHDAIRDGESVGVGDLHLTAVATPGHTGESVCYSLGNGILLTGDTLFVNSVGRPDLEKGDAGAEGAARELWASLHRRLLERFDDVRIFPAHHGEPIGFDDSPIGASLRELRGRLALLGADEPQFVQTVLGGLQSKPPNFAAIIAVNEGRSSLGGTHPLDLEAGPNRCAAS